MVWKRSRGQPPAEDSGNLKQVLVRHSFASEVSECTDNIARLALKSQKLRMRLT